MNTINKLIATSAVLMFSSACVAANTPSLPVKQQSSAPATVPAAKACKVGEKNAAGKIIKKCRKSPFKAPMQVEPYKGKPKSTK